MSGLRCSKRDAKRPLIMTLCLFFDTPRIPLSFSFWPSGAQPTPPLSPLEKELVEEFGVDRLVIGAEAGTYQEAAAHLMNPQSPSYIVGQPLHELSSRLQKWALSQNEWYLDSSSDNRAYSLLDIISDYSRFKDNTFFKERVVKDRAGSNDLRVIALFFPRQYVEQSILRRRVADGVADKGEIGIPLPGGCDSLHAFDPERMFCINPADGFTVVRTNMKDPAPIIARRCAVRWDIKRAFRLEVSELLLTSKVGLPWEDEARTHFLICYAAFLIQCLISARLRAAGFSDFSLSDLLDTLREMNLLAVRDVYIPMYDRTPLTQALEHTFGIPVHREVYDRELIRLLCRKSRND